MASGLDTLASIDAAMHQVRRDIQELDQEIRATGGELVQLSQNETSHFRRLAELRLDAVTNGELLASMDDADRRVMGLLNERHDALQKLRQQIEQSDEHQSALEAERKQQQQRVHAAAQALDSAQAKTQNRLENDSAYQSQLKRAEASDGVAKHAEEKARQSEQDREKKGQLYETDPLFMYLWGRGFGTSAYAANPLSRFLDRWVSRLCRYHNARANYAMLLEIPRRLREHADSARKQAEHELAGLHQLEEQAAAEDGLPQQREDVREAERRAGEIDAAIEQEEARYGEMVKRRSEFAGGDDELSRQCLQVLMEQFRREPLTQLLREAEETIDRRDNQVVRQLTELNQAKERLESQRAERKQIHLRHLSRLEELERVRREFKHKRFDDIHSDFPNGSSVGAMLNEFLRGMANSGQLWNTIEHQHRRRRIDADPDFGSGGFGRGTSGGWSFPIPMPHGGGSIGAGGSVGGGGGGGSIGGSGGFRTGGGF